MEQIAASVREDGEAWGRLVESAIGAHLVNSARETAVEVQYWRLGAKEVDFVLNAGTGVVAIEVKSGKKPEALPGMEAFAKAFKPRRKLLVGSGGLSVEEFLLKPAAHWIGEW
jgi:predicted AAA+ superfamily ATPase